MDTQSLICEGKVYISLSTSCMYKYEGNLAKLFLKSSKCFRKVLQRLVSWIIKQNAGN